VYRTAALKLPTKRVPSTDPYIDQMIPNPTTRAT
jgi:hypothetical protein